MVTQGRNPWDAVQVLFVSVLADAPYIMPANHHVPTPWVVNGYIYRDWLQLQQDHIGSPQMAALLPMGVIPNPASHARRQSERPVRMLYVKSGSDPVLIRARWAAWPIRLQPLLHDCADALSGLDPQPLAPTMRTWLRQHDLVLDGSKPLLFGLMHELDTYLRALRATAMARALLPLPADIVGDGWDHLSGQEGRARFHPAVDAGTLDALYADTRILVNVTPNFATGAHERVLRGFAARCRVLSDNNDHGRTVLRELPSYHGIDWHTPDLADQVSAVFHDPAPFDDQLDRAEN